MHKKNKPASPGSGSHPQGTIDATRLLPPRSSNSLVPRQALTGRLLDARQRRCFVLRGPAGYGKTTALIAWRQQLLPLGYDFAWLTLTGEDNDLNRFLDYLLASLAQVDPEITREAAQLEGRGTDSETVERTVISLVRGIAERGRELVLVLDDLHNLTNTAIHEALQWLLDYAPANLHLTLVSRSVVPLSLARLRSQALTLELDGNDLRFLPEESEQFLKGQLNQITPGEARQLHDLTDGWAAGLQLLCVSRRRPRQVQGEPGQLRDIPAFETFFANEVLAQLSQSDHELLVHMAVCNKFCVPLCAALTGHPQAIGEAATLLERLESDNLFLISVESGTEQRWFRLHPLLRETLLKRFATLGKDEQRTVHARAWSWFRDHDQLDEAVRHAVLGGQAADAARLVEAHSERLYAQGDLRLLVDLMRCLPAEQVQASSALSILMVRLHIFARDFTAASQLLDHLWQTIPHSDAVTRFRLVMLRATLAVQCDDTESAMAVLPQMLHPPREADAVLVGGSINIRSWLYMHRGEYELARRIQLERPQLLVDGMPLTGTAAGTLQGRCLVGLSLAMQGKVNQAERVYRDVLYEAERGGKACTDARHLATALLGQVLYETNQLQAAYELLTGWLDILERISIPDSVLRVYSILGSIQWLAGHRQEAFAYVERLEDYASKLKLDRLQAYSLVWRVYWHLQLGDQVAAETRMAQLDALHARHLGTDDSPLKEIQVLALHAQARMRAARGDLQGASLRLEQLLAWCEGHGRQGLAVRMLMFSASVDRQRGQHELAHTKVMEALRRGHRFGLMRSLLDAHPGALDLINEVAAQESLDPVLTFYVERLQTAGAVAVVGPTLAQEKSAGSRRPAPQGFEELSERELEIMLLLAQALPNKKIARALGLSPETVKWHLSHIYSKLGVNSRDEAVARMRDFESGREDA
ncbi:LuxR C-terminal-related transcriptional regulator [Pseudomonas sp. NPDC090755]|uniref:LuxR C-terminal-related transcriptional regulator n=1 Tax=Pseudomonas sp. NPDC090755 TaxID=3364481 RepID=UPI00383B981B